MSYGLDPYGLGPYGGVGAPTLLEVLPGTVDTLGGDVVSLFGTNFAAPMTAEILSGAYPYVIEGQCFMFDARYDLKRSVALFGVPPMPEGTYHVRVTHPGGSSVLENAITYIPLAHQLKVERVRSAFSSVWASGVRYLSTNGVP